MRSFIGSFFLLGVILFTSSCSNTDETSTLVVDADGASKTDNSGETSLAHTNGSVTIRVKDVDTQANLSGIRISAIELANGLVVWAEDQTNSYYPSVIFVPFGIETSNTIRLASIESASSLGYKYALSPKGVDELFNSSIEQNCIDGNFVDALTAISNSGATDGVNSILRITGAPADLLNQNEFYVGFTQDILDNAILNGTINTILNDIAGIMEGDTQTFCWTISADTAIPIFDINVTRLSSGFAITNVDHLDFYPMFPTRESLATTIDVSWAGTPTLPLSIIFTNVICDKDFTCHDSEQMDHMDNPIVEPFGCWGDFNKPLSGFSTWQVSLEDANGLKTLPVTYSIRCGNDPNATNQDGVISAFSLQWGDKNWTPTNFNQFGLALSGEAYAFDNIPNAPVPNLDIMDFEFHIVDGSLFEVYFNYHNSGVDPQSTILPPQYNYRVTCSMGNACDGIVFDLGARRVTMTDVSIPVYDTGATIDNNQASSPAKVSGTLIW